MAAIAVVPLNMASGTLTIEADDYTAQVNSVTLTPTTPTTTWKDLSGTAHNYTGTPTWAAAIGFVQDLETANSFVQYMLANNGQEKAMVYTPSAGGASISFTAVCVAAAIGGAIDTIGTGTVTLAVNGQPVIAPGV